MILTMTLHKNKDKTTTFTFRVPSSSPTRLYVLNEGGYALTNVPVTALGDDLYTATAFIQDEHYTIYLNTETRYFHLTNEFKALNKDDFDLVLDGNRPILPWCRAEDVKWDLFTADGSRVETWDFWSNSEDYFKDPMLETSIDISNFYKSRTLEWRLRSLVATFKEGDSTWQSPAGVTFYLRASGVTPTVSSVNGSALLTNDDALGKNRGAFIVL